jgi:hypothetical protein
VAAGIGELRLYNNKITAIDSRAFRGMRALTSLQVNGNRLKQITTDLLEDAGRLEILYGRAILHMNMMGLGAAVVYDPCYCCGMFRPLTSHVGFGSNLQENRIAEIEDYAFQSQGNMKYLYVSGVVKKKPLYGVFVSTEKRNRDEDGCRWRTTS